MYRKIILKIRRVISYRKMTLKIRMVISYRKMTLKIRMVKVKKPKKCKWIGDA